MPLSVFNLYVEDYPQPGDTLVHNTFTGAFAVLASDTVAALRRPDTGASLEAAVLDEDAELADPDVAILVESREAEEAEYRRWFEGRFHQGRTLTSMVGINLACNFACTYCCQADVLDGTVMSWETVEQTARFLAERALAIGAESIGLNLVGGEPLLHPDRCKRLLERVRHHLGDADIPVEFSLTTNAYFLDEAMVKDLLPYGLVSAQITLDGDHTTHSTTRVSKKGEDTFQRIFDNVITASRYIRISVNGNYQPDTISGFAPLLDKLAAAGLGREHRVHFSPALAGLGAPEGAGSGACSWSGSDTYQVAFHDAIVSRGWGTGQLNSVGPCGYHNANHFAIEPSGLVQKCPGFLGHAEWGIGHVGSGLSERYREMLAIDVQGDCGGCAHRPSCAGGCVAATWLARGRAEGVNCEHGYFEEVKRDAVVRDYLLATSDSREEAIAAFPPPSKALPLTGSSSTGRGVRPAALRVVAA